MVENFGLYLKHERELRGVSLEEIAETTKIHIRYLEALENNDFDKMPGEVFVKGFIRSYAKVIGFDSEEMVTAYDESVGSGLREELEKVQVTNEKIQFRKKTVARIVIGGIALAAIAFLGYLVVGNIIDENKKQQVDPVPAEEPSPVIENSPISPEATPPVEIESEDIENPDESGNPADSGNLIEESQPRESLQTESLSGDTKTPPAPRTEPKIENPPASASTDSNTKIDPLKVIEEEVAQSEPQATETKPEPSATPSEPVEEEKVALETPIESAVTKKISELVEKPVIIQQVIENLAFSGASDQSFSEPEVEPLHLKIEVQGNSWFNVTVDGSNAEDFILPGGSTKNFYGREKIRLTIGNRNGTHLFLNGQTIDLPRGTSDVIRDFDITANLLE